LRAPYVYEDIDVYKIGMATKQSPNLHMAEADTLFWKNNNYTKKYVFRFKYYIYRRGFALQSVSVIRRRFRAVGEYQITVLHWTLRTSLEEHCEYISFTTNRKMCIYWLEKSSTYIPME
jgi:hypothetical protein